MNNVQSTAALSPLNDNLEKSIKVVQIIMSNRKVSGTPCSNKSYCPRCADVLLEKISSLVSSGKQISFIIPAFPFPMPNPNKSFGIIAPDRAELLSINHLKRFCQCIKSVYSPGGGNQAGISGKR